MEHTHHHDANHKNCCAHEKKDTNIRKIIEKSKEYQPLIVVLVFCLTLSFELSYLKISHFQLNHNFYHDWMCSFMGYFFIFLAMFKFFDLTAFVEGFSTYDLITNQVRAYGYLYPWIEFCLGLAYLGPYQNSLILNVITAVLMVLSGMGVLKSVLSGQKIKCACLGTALNVPLSTVSLLENFGMAAMALYQIFKIL